MVEVLGDQLSVGQGGVLIGGGSGGSARGPASASWHVGSGVSGLFPALGCLRGCKQFGLGLAILSHAPPSPAQFVFVFLSEGGPLSSLVLACLQTTPCIPLLDSPGWTLPLPLSVTPCTPLLPFAIFTPFILPSTPFLPWSQALYPTTERERNVAGEVCPSPICLGFIGDLSAGTPLSCLS